MKYKRLPKAPRKTASATTWQNYTRRVEDVNKHNAQVDKDMAALKKAKADAETLRNKLGSYPGIKAPKRPKSKSLQVWQNHLATLKDRVKQGQDREKAQKKAETAAKKYKR